MRRCVIFHLVTHLNCVSSNREQSEPFFQHNLNIYLISASMVPAPHSCVSKFFRTNSKIHNYLLEIAGESRSRLTRRQHQGQEAARSPGFGEKIEVVAELNTPWEVLHITVCRCQPRAASFGVG